MSGGGQPGGQRPPNLQSCQGRNSQYNLRHDAAPFIPAQRPVNHSAQGWEDHAGPPLYTAYSSSSPPGIHPPPGFEFHPESWDLGPPPGYEQCSQNPQGFCHPNAGPTYRHNGGSQNRAKEPGIYSHPGEGRQPRSTSVTADGSRFRDSVRRRGRDTAGARHSSRGRFQPSQPGRSVSSDHNEGAKPDDFGLGGPAPKSAPVSGEDSEKPECSVCYEDLKVVSIGKCNHKSVCALCCLRMRKQNGTHNCPLCKARLEQVVLTQQKANIPEWKQWSGRLRMLWSSNGWAAGVFVDDQQHPRQKGKLSAELQSLTGKICPLCPRAGAHVYPTHKSLLRHMEKVHQRTMCLVCLVDSMRFPVEMETYAVGEMAEHFKGHPICPHCLEVFTEEEQLLNHVRMEHFLCFICLMHGREIAFGSHTDYSRHLRTHHFACMHPECREMLIAFPTAQMLQEHTVEEHHTTASHRLQNAGVQVRSARRDRRRRPRDPVSHSQEDSPGLQRHRSREAVYSAAETALTELPSADQVEAGVAQADESDYLVDSIMEMFSERLWGALHGMADQEQQHRDANPQAQHSDFQEAIMNRVRQELPYFAAMSQDDVGSPSEAQAASERSRTGSRQNEQLPQQQQQEGLRILDDDFGMTGEAFRRDDREHETESVSHTGRRDQEDREELRGLISQQLPAVESSRRQYSEQQLSNGIELSELSITAPPEPFPALPGSGGTAQASERGPHTLQTPAEAHQETQRTSYRYPRLVSVTRRCPCGRRYDRPVVPEGGDVNPLLCDEACAVNTRRAQLADAFGIADPDAHVPVMDRSHTVVHSPELLLYARDHQDWVKDVELIMSNFLRSKENKRDLPAMPRTQRKIVHEMAPAWGLTSASFGQEPSRHLRLLKGANAAAPSNLLSKDAARLTQEQLDAVLTKQQSYVLHLRDVHISADLPRMFSRWSSDCSISGPDRNGDATITFQTGDAMKDAASFFGGGVRGKFKIDRSQTPEIK